MNLFSDDVRTRNSISCKLNITNNISDILFPIDIKNIYGSGVNDEDSYDTDYKGVFRLDTFDCLYIGKNYEIIENEVIMNSLEPLIKEGFEYNRIESYNDTKFKIDMINKTVSVKVQNEIVHPKIQITNSYDGSNSLSLAIGAFIFVCGNGLIIGQADTFKHKHTQSLRDFDLDNFFLNGYKNTLDNTLNYLTDKIWPNEKEEVEDKFMKLIKPFSKGDKVHPLANMLKKRFIIENNKYDNKEFALMMASTYLGTHGYKEGVSYQNQNIINKNVSEIFFN